MSNVKDTYIENTKVWIEKFIIKRNICPFAAIPYNEGRIIYRQDDATTEESILFSLATFLRNLSFKLDDFSNAFLILPMANRNDFTKFLDVVEIANVLLYDMKMDETFQLVAFHPLFLYQDAEIDDFTNYTNRSPFPMIHILKVLEVAEAIKQVKDPMEISNRNIQVLSNLSKGEKSQIKSLL